MDWDDSGALQTIWPKGVNLLMFGLKFEQEFENVAAQRYEQNDAFFVKMFQDSDVMKTVIEMLKPIIYRKMRKKK